MSTNKELYAVLSIARYPKGKWMFGLLSMALFRMYLWRNKNISFWKLMGCGKNGTFDIHPDWHQWGILTVYDADYLQNNLLQNQEPNTFNLYGAFIAKWFTKHKCELFTIVLKPMEGHGKWDGKNAFGELNKLTNYNGAIATLTRATIRAQKLKAFWKNVSGVAHVMNDAPGFVASVGIGEVPWIKQATFSIWQSKEAMKQFAYRMQQHADVIKKTRSENWYSEEMFVRFIPLHCWGLLNGKKVELPV